MAKPTPELPPSLWDTAFEPYATAIGFLLREQNILQERLCDLFCTIINAADYDVPRVAWYAIQSDRAQRAMLKSVAERGLSRHEKLTAEVVWLATAADGLGSQRDDAVHSPVALMLKDPPEFISKHLLGPAHPRATSLKGKALIAEFVHYRARAEVLAKYSMILNQFIPRQRERAEESEPLPLPQRPTLPKPPHT